MEYKLEASEISCLEPLVNQSRQQERTQEVKLTDGMPDVGRILGCWGQPVIRSKDWRSDSIGFHGGVMAWVLYAPEDGAQPRVVECWIPFQSRWDIPDADTDGTIMASAQIRSMDARVTSARKIMVRCVLNLGAKGSVRIRKSVYGGEIPGQIPLLRQTYPMRLPVEAGEREVTLDEEILLPGNNPHPEKIIRFSLTPRINETKLMGSRLVFRGMCSLHMVYLDEEGTVSSWDAELPIAQFSDLDGSYDTGSECCCVPIVTGTELERGEDGKCRIKASLAVQYEIIDRVMVSIVEDAYCPDRSVAIQKQPLALSPVLDMGSDVWEVSQSIHADARQVVDSCVYCTVSGVRTAEDSLQAQLQIASQVLYLDENGALQGGNVRSEELWTLPSQPDNHADVCLIPGIPNIAVGEDISIHCDLTVISCVFGDAAMEMVTAVSVSEQKEADPHRPALILKRVNGKRLWDIAKECGSTVEAIRKANALDQEPLDDRMLLIPVL